MISIMVRGQFTLSPFIASRSVGTLCLTRSPAALISFAYNVVVTCSYCTEGLS